MVNSRHKKRYLQEKSALSKQGLGMAAGTDLTGAIGMENGHIHGQMCRGAGSRGLGILMEKL